jgi:uncharacterized membrane protein YfcA
MLEAIGGLIIGVCLGLLGSGGSILAVPILVYLLGHEPKIAIAESLAIVGGISLLASIRPWLEKRIDWPAVLMFGVPAMIGTVLGVWGSQWMGGREQLMLFGVVMLIAAILMFRGRGEVPEAGPRNRTVRGYVILVLEGAGVGILTGIIGVGGGFMIVPALVLLGRLPMGLAVGTSLVIIAVKSGAGFVKSIGQFPDGIAAMDLATVGLFILMGGIGGILGNVIGGRLPQQRLKQVFAVFLLVVAAIIMIGEATVLLGFGAQMGGIPVDSE